MIIVKISLAIVKNLFTYLANVTTPYVSKAHAKQLANILDIDFLCNWKTQPQRTFVRYHQQTTTSRYLLIKRYMGDNNNSYGIWHIYRDEEPILAIFNNHYLLQKYPCKHL